MGFYHSGELKKRERLLAEILTLLECMAVQIRYQALPLKDLFRSQSGRFIDKVVIHSGSNFREAWIKAAGEFPELDEDDVKLLISIGQSLGASDTAGQTSLLEMNKELFSARLKQAAEASAKKAAMFRTVGLLAGLGIAILII